MNIKMHPLADIVLHIGILLIVASMLIHDGFAGGVSAKRHAEWKSHEKAMTAMEAHREMFFEKWSTALQSAECEATVIEAIKGTERRS